MNKIYIYIVILLLSISNLFAIHDFRAIIVDSQSKDPLPGASVKIENTTFGAYANSKGEFVIKNIPDKIVKSTLIISMIGYGTIKVNVDFINDNNKTFQLVIQPLQTGEVIVSASKKVQAVQDVPISVSVIDKRVLIDRGINRLDDALEYVPGVEVNQDNASIRGSSGFSFGVGSRVALLVDGFPLITGDNGDIKFDALPMLNIDRVEVVKGAGSALWGTGAIGGVINLIIEEPNEDLKIKYRSFAGFYTQPRFEKWQFVDGHNTNSGVNLSISQKFDKLGIVASGSLYRDQGYRDFDQSNRYNLFSKIGYEFSNNTKLKILLNNALEERDDWVYWNSLDSATRPPSSTIRNNKIKSYKYTGFAELSHSFDFNNFGIFKFGINSTEYSNSFTTSNPEYRQSDANSYFYDLQGVSNFELWGRGINLTYGFTQNYIDVSSFNYGPKIQNIAAGYMQAEYNLPDVFTITFGGRFDKELTEGIETDIEFSPKIGINFPVNEALRLRASAGRGFRVASVAERYSAIFLQGFEVIPNLGLNPESSLSVEAGGNFQFKFDDNLGEIDFSVFHNDLNNLIEPTFQTDVSAKIQFRNVVRAKIQGAEVGLRTLLFNAVGFESSFTFMKPVDLTTDKILNYRSEILWYSRVIIPYKFLELQLDYRYKSRVKNVDVQLGLLVRDIDARVDMNVIDLRLITDFKQIMDLPFRITLNASNMLDYYYTEMVGNLARTRFLSIQIDGEL